MKTTQSPRDRKSDHEQMVVPKGLLMFSGVILSLIVVLSVAVYLLRG